MKPNGLQFRAWILTGAIALVLSWLIFEFSWRLEFASGSENLVVATALESHRSGQWLLPTLNQQPRVKKPPLPMWWTAAFITPSVRKGNVDLAWWTRLSVVPLMWVTLMSTFSLARTLGLPGRWMWVAVGVCATSLLFMRFARSATVDAHLMTWVALATAAWMVALRRGSGTASWVASAVAGVALGLAFMSKGPVALLQCGLPMLAMAALLGLPLGHWCHWLLGAGCFCVIALPWFVMVYLSTAGVGSTWAVELHRVGATPFKSDSPLTYLIFVVLMLPWSVFLVVGMVDGLRHLRRRGRWSVSAIALLLVLVPVLVMSLFPDRKDRYLLPMVVPASLLVVQGFRLLARHQGRFNRVDRAVIVLHGVVLAGMALVLGWALWEMDLRYLSLPAAAVLLGLIAFALARVNRRILDLLLVTQLTGVVMIVGGLSMYAQMRQGKSELRPLATLILREVPGAQVVHVNPEGLFLGPNDLAIYLNQAVSLYTRLQDVPLPTDRPQVLVLLQKNGTPPPQPEGWRVLGSTPRDDDVYWAFVRETVPNRSGTGA